jgi:hypothetical protein
MPSRAVARAQRRPSRQSAIAPTVTAAWAGDHAVTSVASSAVSREASGKRAVSATPR